MSPPRAVLLCSECGDLPYAIAPEAAARIHADKNPGHAVAYYALKDVVRASRWSA